MLVTWYHVDDNVLYDIIKVSRIHTNIVDFFSVSCKMFEKNLQDLVKGIRSTKLDINIYISQCIQSIKTELKSTDPFIKSQAIRKLTYLNMLGYDMAWASFYIVEVMSYERFSHKRIGYTAACQSFRQDTEVVLLCTNLLKKELKSRNEYEIGLAINAISNIVTNDLARDLLSDIIELMYSPHCYVRKKATLVLYKLYLRYPQGLRLTFDQLKKQIEDTEISVISCAVNVICELANKKPKNYLGLVPVFFQLLTSCSNNWMLIKVVKLLASLVPEEPRLARKLLDPLATIIQNTPAKSLLYECIHTVTVALLYTKKQDGGQPRNVVAIVKLCNDHLRRYIEDQDQNLRYLGLVGLTNLMQSHPYVITEHQGIIIECLNVDDVTIRMRALELLARMIDASNAVHIIKELLRQTFIADGMYRHELITRILYVCGANKYENIHDFEWYIDVLVQLARIPSTFSQTVDMNVQSGRDARYDRASDKPSKSVGAGTYEDIKQRSHGFEVARQLIDIAVRVVSVRNVIVENMIALLLENQACTGPNVSTLCEVYFAAAWITGEYLMEYLEENEHDDVEDESDDETETVDEKLHKIYDLAEEFLRSKTTDLPSNVQSVYLQTLLKFVMAFTEHAEQQETERLAALILKRISPFLSSEHIEVQERAVCLQQILFSFGMGLEAVSPEARASFVFDRKGIVPDSSKRAQLLASFFAERLAPVGMKAQRKVPLPETLDLDRPLNEKEASFLVSGGDISYSNDDDLDVSFAQPKSISMEREHRRHNYAKPCSSDEISSSESEIEVSQKAKKSQKTRTKDPFYLSSAVRKMELQTSTEFIDMKQVFKKHSKVCLYLLMRTFDRFF